MLESLLLTEKIKKRKLSWSWVSFSHNSPRLRILLTHAASLLVPHKCCTLLKPSKVNLFKGKHGNLEIKRTRKGWTFNEKDVQSDIDTKDWRFEDLKFSVIRINEILGVGGEGFVYYDSKLKKAVKIVQKHFGSKRKYKIEHDKWRSGQFSGKLDDLLQELKRYGKGFQIFIRC